jgi:hypothetical protein
MFSPDADAGLLREGRFPCPDRPPSLSIAADRFARVRKQNIRRAGRHPLSNHATRHSPLVASSPQFRLASQPKPWRRLVRTAGLEPARLEGQKILSLQRLPVPPRPHARDLSLLRHSREGGSPGGLREAL